MVWIGPALLHSSNPVIVILHRCLLGNVGVWKIVVDAGFFEEYLGENGKKRIGPLFVHSSNYAFLAILILHRCHLGNVQGWKIVVDEGFFVEWWRTRCYHVGWQKHQCVDSKSWNFPSYFQNLHYDSNVKSGINRGNSPCRHAVWYILTRKHRPLLPLRSITPFPTTMCNVSLGV